MAEIEPVVLWHIGHREIQVEVLEVVQGDWDIKSLEIPEESRPQVHLEGTVHGGDRGGDHRERADKEAVHRCLAHRDIGNPVDVVFTPFEIANRETPISGGQLSAHQGRGKSHSGSQLSVQRRVGNRRIADPRGHCILALKSPNPDARIRHKAAVLCENGRVDQGIARRG
jgi:hypothetical protein